MKVIFDTHCHTGIYTNVLEVHLDNHTGNLELIVDDNYKFDGLGGTEESVFNTDDKNVKMIIGPVLIDIMQE